MKYQGPLNFFKETKVPEDLLKNYGIKIDEGLDFTEFIIVNTNITFMTLKKQNSMTKTYYKQCLEEYISRQIKVVQKVLLV